MEFQNKSSNVCNFVKKTANQCCTKNNPQMLTLSISTNTNFSSHLDLSNYDIDIRWYKFSYLGEGDSFSDLNPLSKCYHQNQTSLGWEEIKRGILYFYNLHRNLYNRQTLICFRI